MKKVLRNAGVNAALVLVSFSLLFLGCGSLRAQESPKAQYVLTAAGTVEKRVAEVESRLTTYENRIQELEAKIDLLLKGGSEPVAAGDPYGVVKAPPAVCVGPNCNPVVLANGQIVRNCPSGICQDGCPCVNESTCGTAQGTCYAPRQYPLPSRTGWYPGKFLSGNGRARVSNTCQSCR